MDEYPYVRMCGRSVEVLAEKSSTLGSSVKIGNQTKRQCGRSVEVLEEKSNTLGSSIKIGNHTKRQFFNVTFQTTC